MKIYMFPGQGSQFKGMGGSLFDEFGDYTDRADAILGYSVKTLCLEDPRQELGNTQFTQPALYVVNALSYFKKQKESGVDPDFLIGHSLGEFNALMAAGCFDFETGLRLVQRRGMLMSRMSRGGMAAVINLSKEDIEHTLRSNGLTRLYLANYNTPSQIVISGAQDEIERAQPLFRGDKVRYFPLATGGAFHSPLMQEAMVQFAQYLEGVAFAPPRMPVIANVTGRPYPAADLVGVLSRQIGSTVLWCDSVQYLLALAAKRHVPVTFEELGSGDVLTRLVQAIRAQTPQALLDRLVEDIEPALAIEPAPAAHQTAHQPAREAAQQSARQKVEAWNRKYPPGTRARSTVAGGQTLETSSEAVVLFDHRAAVYMKGYNGYFDLDELMPA
jgi:malonyl CoA-acyl carrier protein transacylase